MAPCAWRAHPSRRPGCSSSTCAGFFRLGDVRADTVVAYGTATAEPSGAWAPEIARALPNGTAQAWEGYDHFGCFADLDRVVASLNGFFLNGA
ncbi:MAG: hypothetical protein R2755_21190 [Acidimicrobiales bacterium]